MPASRSLDQCEVLGRRSWHYRWHCHHAHTRPKRRGVASQPEFLSGDVCTTRHFTWHHDENSASKSGLCGFVWSCLHRWLCLGSDSSKPENFASPKFAREDLAWSLFLLLLPTVHRPLVLELLVQLHREGPGLLFDECLYNVQHGTNENWARSGIQSGDRHLHSPDALSDIWGHLLRSVESTSKDVLIANQCEPTVETAAEPTWHGARQGSDLLAGCQQWRRTPPTLLKPADAPVLRRRLGQEQEAIGQKNQTKVASSTSHRPQQGDIWANSV